MGMLVASLFNPKTWTAQWVCTKFVKTEHCGRKNMNINGLTVTLMLKNGQTDLVTLNLLELGGIKYYLLIQFICMIIKNTKMETMTTVLIIKLFL